MGRLNTGTLGNPPPGLNVPQYQRSEVTAGIAHFGVGGFHRSHQAVYLDDLMNQGKAMTWGVCGIGVLPGDAAMASALRAQDMLYTLAVKHPDGHTEDRVIGSLVNYIYAPSAPAEVIRVLTEPCLRIVSLTITEGGYGVDPATGEFDPGLPGIAEDIGRSADPTSVFGYLTEALRIRRLQGTEPFAVLSCDNIRGNGAVARQALVSFASHQDPEAGQWIAEHVSFPSTMVDRITPVTTEEDRAALSARLSIDDAWPVVCEPFRQWVVQDAFPSGRPPLEDAGVTVVHDVEAYELVKLRLLNGSHQVIGQFGRLAGISYVHDVLADPALKRLAELYMKQEAEPTLTPIGGVSFDDYEATLIERFANPAIADTTDRLCAFTSDRIPPWIIPVLQANRDGGGQIAICATLIAAWARASSHPDDAGTEIPHTDNRMSAMLEATRAAGEDPLAFVRNSQLFGDFELDDQFKAEYLAAWASLRTRGAIGTAASLVARLELSAVQQRAGKLSADAQPDKADREAP